MKVIEKQKVKKEIDWSKGGQLVVSENCEYVLTSGYHDGIIFSGTRLKNGVLTPDYIKGCFRLVEGPVTFEND